jgi:membrane protease YdiL (CAAX protease family)
MKKELENNQAAQQKESKKFLGYYWAELKKLLNPAGPLVISAIYSFVMIFPRYHRDLFRLNLFPQARIPEILAVDGLWYMLLPLLAVLVIFLLSLFIPGVKKVFPKHTFADYGFRLGRWVGWRDTLIFYSIMLVVVIILVVPIPFLADIQKPFLNMYPMFKMAAKSLVIFLIWESIHLLHMFGWEFLNRGFLLFGLEDMTGRWAIVASAIPFAILHIGKPELEAYGSFIAAIALGWVAYRSRSFLPSVFLHWGVAFTGDLLVIIRNGGFTG